MSEADQLAVPVGADDHVRGPADAPVTLVEYGDVECPYCGRLEGELRALLAERDDVRVVFRHFPLVEVHAHAYAGALALEAAAQHGRFWELHDLLFAHQDALTRDDLAGYATELGIDPLAVQRPASEAHDERVRADFAGGLEAGIQGTPALFLNGERYAGRLRRGALGAAIEGAGHR